MYLATKKLDRFTMPGHRVTGDRKERNRSPGWAYVFAVVDSHSSLAYADTRVDERKESAIAYLLSTLRHDRWLGVEVRVLMTAGAKVFKSKRFQRVLRGLDIKHKTAPPYTLRVKRMSAGEMPDVALRLHWKVEDV